MRILMPLSRRLSGGVQTRKIVVTGGSGDLVAVLMPKLEVWEHAGLVGCCAAARPLWQGGGGLRA
jgi:hypothetical protein